MPALPRPKGESAGAKSLEEAGHWMRVARARRHDGNMQGQRELSGPGQEGRASLDIHQSEPKLEWPLGDERKARGRFGYVP